MTFKMSFDCNDTIIQTVKQSKELLKPAAPCPCFWSYDLAD